MYLQDHIDLFCRLGLTPNQAKVYLALVKSSPCTANQIAKTASLAAEVVYRNITKLQEQGFIEKIITSPAKYQAIPLKDAVDLLLKQKIKENAQARTQAKALLESSLVEENVKPPIEESKIILIPSGQRLVKFAEERFVGLQKELDLAITSLKLNGWIQTNNKLFQKIASKKNTVRLIIFGNEIECPVHFTELFSQNHNLKIEWSSESVPACFAILDHKEAIITTSTQTAFARSPAYWSNNSCVVALCENCFDSFWKGNKFSKNIAKQPKNFPKSAEDLIAI